MPTFPPGPPGSIYPTEVWQGPLARYQNLRDVNPGNLVPEPESTAIVDTDAS